MRTSLVVDVLLGGAKFYAMFPLPKVVSCWHPRYFCSHGETKLLSLNAHVSNVASTGAFGSSSFRMFDPPPRSAPLRSRMCRDRLLEVCRNQIQRGSGVVDVGCSAIIDWQRCYRARYSGRCCASQNVPRALIRQATSDDAAQRFQAYLQSPDSMARKFPCTIHTVPEHLQDELFRQVDLALEGKKSHCT